MAEFAGAGQKPGLEVWRIEKMVPTPWADHGKFCTGDSYIVLKTNAVAGKNALEHDLHFWLGTETSQDEMGVAAYKTVELDDSLGGGPVQHREVQNHESQLFLSYFKGGIQYIAGGVDSGFTKVERDVYDTRLLHCKGRRAVRVQEVAVSASSMNSGDVFILDCGLTIYQWNGKDANRKEKTKALDVTRSIKDEERGGRAKVQVFDEGSESDEFWAALGGKGDIKSAEAGGADEEADAASNQRVLHRISDQASGSLEVTEVGNGKLSKDMLDTNDCFVLDAGSEVFVWVGKGATANEKKNSMITGNQFLNQSGKPTFTKLTKVVEGGETPLFKEKFADWHDMRAPTDFSAPVTSSVAKVAKKDVDIASMMKANSPADEPVDDGSGKLDIWRIENFDKEVIDKQLFGQFFAGDSYIILYTYMQGTRESYIIYFWQGRDSTADEKGASAILATKMDDDLGGAATQVRVVQGKEPNHFLSLFKGKMIIHSGGKASGFKNKADTDSYDTDGVSLFHVKGTNAVNTRAVQVAEKASSLNSGDSFLLLTPETVYLWYGKGCNDAEKASAQGLGEVLKKQTMFKTVTEVNEGEEPTKFWDFVGGKDDYASSADLEEAPREPRLFGCSNATGNFEVEEIFNFSQDDLDDNDAFLLDVWTECYVWLGSQANDEERKMAPDTAAKYLAMSGREETPVVVVHAGSEPNMFKMAFLGWDDSAAQVFEDPYTKKLRLIEEAKAKERGEEYVAPAAAAPAAAPANYADPASTVYSLADLQARVHADVDPSQRENYLSDDEFKKVFKMDKAAFADLKKWKKDQLKKDNKLW